MLESFLSVGLPRLGRTSLRWSQSLQQELQSHSRKVRKVYKAKLLDHLSILIAGINTVIKRTVFNLNK